MKNKFTFRENWYFIRQDIVSYLMSTTLYLGLCLIENCSMQCVGYALFDCLVFYLPFWYIRINFASTYHSDSWKHCKMWTRIMLCVGVIILWVLPVRYSLFNGLFVAFGCCLVLYLVSLEVAEKKRIAKENVELYSQITKLLDKEVSPKDKLLKLCEEKNINERDTKIAVMYYVDRCTPKQIWQYLCANKMDITWDSVYKLLNRLNKKLNN